MKVEALAREFRYNGGLRLPVSVLPLLRTRMEQALPTEVRQRLPVKRIARPKNCLAATPRFGLD